METEKWTVLYTRLKWSSKNTQVEECLDTGPELRESQYTWNFKKSSI